MNYQKYITFIFLIFFYIIYFLNAVAINRVHIEEWKNHRKEFNETKFLTDNTKVCQSNKNNYKDKKN